MQLAANVANETVYITYARAANSTSPPLIGSTPLTLTFDNTTIPPVALGGFWSLIVRIQFSEGRVADFGSSHTTLRLCSSTLIRRIDTASLRILPKQLRPVTAPLCPSAFLHGRDYQND